MQGSCRSTLSRFLGARIGPAHPLRNAKAVFDAVRLEEWIFVKKA
jgi:hypothetical protein